MLIVDPQQSTTYLAHKLLQQQQQQREVNIQADDRSSQQQLTNGVDSEISVVLQENLPIDIKVKKYYSVLNKHLKDVLPESVTAGENTTESLPMDIHHILQSIRNTQRHKVYQLLTLIKNSPDGSWSSRGELIYKQQVIPNSNIIELMTNLMKPVYKVPKKPKPPYTTGWFELCALLKSLDVPNDLIINRIYWNYIKPTVNNNTDWEDIDETVVPLNLDETPSPGIEPVSVGHTPRSSRKKAAKSKKRLRVDWQET